MSDKKTAVFGVFSDRVSLERAVDNLKAASFTSDDISVLLPDKEGTRDFAHEKNTKAPEGAATGAGTGAVLGGTLGWLVGAGMLAIPGVGPFIAAGPIMAALAGATIGGTVGGVTGALVGMGLPEFEAKRYESKIKEGGFLLSVHASTSEQISRAKEILKECNASDISSAGESKAPKADRDNSDPIDPSMVRKDSFRDSTNATSRY